MDTPCPVSQGGKEIQREVFHLKEEEEEEGAALIYSNPQICSSVIGPYLVCCLCHILVSIEIYITNHAFIVVTSICHCFTQATLPYTDVVQRPDESNPSSCVKNQVSNST